MQLEPNEIHIWSTDLTIHSAQEKSQFLLLNSEERERALRFRFPIHKRRFIAARHALRQILSLYLSTPPEQIGLAYAKHHKPYLSSPHQTALQFNLAHSEEIAVYAFTLNHQVGIDIEKIQPTYNPDIAKRFFSPDENQCLTQLAPQDQTTAFYRIWSRKEALIKAVGKGFSIPLSSFSVAVNDVSESIPLENDEWSLMPLSIHNDYKSAVASNQIIKRIKTWRYTENDHKLINIFTF